MTSTSLTDADLDKLQQLLENIGATEVPKTKAAEESRKGNQGNGMKRLNKEESDMH